MASQNSRVSSRHDDEHTAASLPWLPCTRPPSGSRAWPTRSSAASHNIADEAQNRDTRSHRLESSLREYLNLVDPYARELVEVLVPFTSALGLERGGLG